MSSSRPIELTLEAIDYTLQFDSNIIVNYKCCDIQKSL